MHLLKNKIIIVTGGAGLLGREFIKTIVKNGGTGIIADVAKDSVKISNQLIKETNNKNIYFIRTDITSKIAILSLLKTVNHKYGKVDALVNNAYPRNKNFGRDFFDVEYKDFCDNVNINLGGYFLTSQQFAKYFKEQGFGNIVNISSIYGVIAPRFEIYKNTTFTMPVEYAVIKSALIQFTKYLAKYLKGTGIRVNSISPGGIFDKQPANFLKGYKSFSLSKGILDKSDISGTLVFLLSDMSRYINGQNIIVDDGFTL